MTSDEPLSSTGPIPLSRRARLALPATILLLAILSAQRYCGETPRSLVTFEGSAMGTTWAVKIAADLDPDSERVAEREISTRLDRVDQLMSTWKPDSELSRFNRHSAGSAFPVSPETLSVFEIAREVSELSGGAFDVTVGPIVGAWGFGAGARSDTPVSARELAALRSIVGFEKVSIDSAASTLTKSNDGVVCDLSAVAKGFAVDEIARALERLGHENFLIEVGGELRASGTHRDGAPWRIAIEAPDSTSRSVHRIIDLRDLSMATSGDYRNYYELEGRRISHTIDPRTASPIRHGLASVTVLHREAARADALATALNVLGPGEGYALAAERGIAAYFIERGEGGSFEARLTESFERHLGSRPGDES